MFYFEKLIVWQKASSYAISLVKIADQLPSKYQFSFSDQLRRAGLSIPSNIAEGSGRRTHKDQGSFYAIALGSVYESVTILKLLEKLNLVHEVDLFKIYSDAEEICKILYSLSRQFTET